MHYFYTTRDEADNNSRRRFLKQSVGLLGIATAMSIGDQVVRTGTTNARESLPNVDYLVPSYLPLGYELLAEAEDTAGPVGGGWTEHITWYSDPSAPPSTQSTLTIYQSPRPRASWLTSLQLADGKPFEMQQRSGEVVPAKYIESWKVRQNPPDVNWDSSDVHALTCTLTGLAVAVRGSRLAGVSRDELVRVALSMTEPL